MVDVNVSVGVVVSGPDSDWVCLLEPLFLLVTTGKGGDVRRRRARGVVPSFGRGQSPVRPVRRPSLPSPTALPSVTLCVTISLVASSTPLTCDRDQSPFLVSTVRFTPPVPWSLGVPTLHSLPYRGKGLVGRTPSGV